MRHSKEYLKKCSRMGKESQRIQDNKRLSGALNTRSTHNYLVFEIWTHNPRTGIKHHLEIKHETNNGNNRYYVYLDGKRWRKPWSRLGFCRWLFRKIDSVVYEY